jgi:hypothetical protein
VSFQDALNWFSQTNQSFFLCSHQISGFDNFKSASLSSHIRFASVSPISLSGFT